MLISLMFYLPQDQSREGSGDEEPQHRKRRRHEEEESRNRAYKMEKEDEERRKQNEKRRAREGGCNVLTHCGLATPYVDIEVVQHWLR